MTERDKRAMAEFEEFLDLKEHAQDFVDTYTNSEIAQMVREGIVTIDEVEDGLRRRMMDKIIEWALVGIGVWAVVSAVQIMVAFAKL